MNIADSIINKWPDHWDAQGLIQLSLLQLMGGLAEATRHSGHISVPAVGVFAGGASYVSPSTQSQFSVLSINPLQPSLALNLLQTGLISSDMPLLTGSDLGSFVP